MNVEKAPQDLSYWEALALLLPEVAPDDRNALSLPKSWTAWQEPKKQPEHLRLFAEAVEKLVQGRQAKLTPIGIKCPYFYARRSVALAVVQAGLTTRKEEGRKVAAKRAKAHEKMMEDLAQKLERLFFDTSNPDRFFNTAVAPWDEFGIGRPDTATVNSALQTSCDALDKIRAGIEGLRTLAKMSEAERKRLAPPSDKRHLWIEGFVQALAVTYYNLSDRTPPKATTGDFVEFANAAYVALGGDAIEDKTIRNAVPYVRDDRPEWDRFDRYAFADERPSDAELAEAQADAADQQLRRLEADLAEHRKIAENLGLVGDRASDFVMDAARATERQRRWCAFLRQRLSSLPGDPDGSD